MPHPASLVAVPLMAGACAGLQLHGISPGCFALCSAGAALMALAAGIAACADGARNECSVAVVVGALLAGASLGSDAARRAYAPPLIGWYESNATGQAVTLEGVLREDAAASPFGVSLAVDVHGIAPATGTAGDLGATAGGVRLTIGGTLAAGRIGEWRAGRIIRVTAWLRPPAVYRNRGVTDDRKALARRGIALVGSVKSADLVELVGRGPALSEAAAACRAWARARLSSAVGGWSRRSGAVSAAILIGDRTGLSDEDERRLQEAGTYHVVAISGGNVAVLTLLLLGVLRLLRVPARAAAAASILLLVFYGRIAAGGASVDRAVTAACVYLAGRTIDQSGPALNVLAVAAMLGVGVRPDSVFDPGFLLSFGATLGILLGVPRLLGRHAVPGGLPAAAATVLAATIAAEVALAPIGAAFFARVTFAGLLLNFAAIPLMTIVQIGSLLVLASDLWSADLARAVGFGVHAAADWLVESARLVEYAPWLSIRVAPPHWWVAAAYYLSVGVALLETRYARQAWIAAGAAAGLILTGPPLAVRDAAEPPTRKGLRVVLLDVGQGDASVVILPDGRALLVDAGGLPAPVEGDGGAGFDVGARVVVPALRALGIRRLETLIVTHGDPDHIGGAPAVLRALRPRTVWEGVPVPPHPALRALAEAAHDGRIEWRTMQTGNLVRASGVELRVLHPPPPEWERQRVRNEDSIVLELRYGQTAIVLPGDIGPEGESAVLAHFARARVVVLKAPHHGSATSSTPTFIARLRPDAVIFSAGRANRFGHPAPAVVARYRALAAALFSTAEDGAVIVDSDGETVEIRGWTGRRVVLAPAASTAASSAPGEAGRR